MLHPIHALNNVIEEYRDYLLTEFHAKDRSLREALERELDRPGFLAQEPFFQAHRPFKPGKRWAELPLDPQLARVMAERARSYGSSEPQFAFLHQSDSISHLLGPGASPLVVTTGTGSGKTECFLLPVIQNAIEDATRFKKSGLTAILLYPMNALANDQLARIESYLAGSGFEGAVRVGKYDRSTSEAERDKLRNNPPHILLTNYMMLEYLLVRPKDREDIFANHRCRFLVLDEVHTYRGTLGTNIALLVRRVQAHLALARQDWFTNVSDADRPRRFPKLIAVGTSATIKTPSGEGMSREQQLAERDREVREFFAKLTGAEAATIKVLGEELKDVAIPPEAQYPASIIPDVPRDLGSPDAVRSALCSLAGVPAETGLPEAARRCRILWDLNHWLIRKPMSVGQIVEALKSDVPARENLSADDLRREVEAALNIGAALPEGTPGSLRLRAHSFIRGGWQFHRCLNPECGRLYPMGEQDCECGYQTAPLYLCRNCGAHYLRLVGDDEAENLKPGKVTMAGEEWMVYDPALEPPIDDEDADDDETRQEHRRQAARMRQPTQIRNRPVMHGSFDPKAVAFSSNPDDYKMKVSLAPARVRCLCCGGTAGSRSVLTPVALGTSAAVKVLSEGLVESLQEANQDRQDYDGKDRLLVFADSRQDAAHQARFITFSSRFDRMRRRVMQLLKQHGPLTMQRMIELLSDLAFQHHDNPQVPQGEGWPTDEAKSRVRAWEEAPVLDEIAVNAGYRSTVFNLGLAMVDYERLGEYVETKGAELAARLGVEKEKLEYVCHCLLDEMRVRGCLDRQMLRYHPAHPSCPQHIVAADWERRVKQPRGVSADAQGNPVSYLESSAVPSGITPMNLWRRGKAGGRSPSLQRIFQYLTDRFGGGAVSEDDLIELMDFLRRGSYITHSQLFGWKQSHKLLQVNSEIVRIAPVTEAIRMRCEVCGRMQAGATAGFPCPRCHGKLRPLPDAEVEQSRTVRRIRAASLPPLVAGEHTAQVTTQDRIDLENQFKAKPEDSPTNLLACSPTLELGIDVGGLDAVVMRNIPPRPDNYAQRGGRAGRRSRVGLVVGYCRSTPHDQYFYDKPEEMIAGEVPTPSLALGNRDVILRHLNAIAFGAADPGLSGQMVAYVTPMGEVKQEAVDALIAALKAQSGHAVSLAQQAWGQDILAAAQISTEALTAELDKLPVKAQDLVNRTARQVRELRIALDSFAAELKGRQAGNRAADLVARLLGIQSEGRRGQKAEQADDRSAGYPLRRFAEFGILPGYEFPSEPASLRLIGDPHEDDPVSTTRRFGIGQYQPAAQVYARGRRWRVAGLDRSSPWNPQGDGQALQYRVCEDCGLRYEADQPRCPRCRKSEPGQACPAMEYAGFAAVKDESPIMDEEDRFATKNLVKVYAQWDGDVSSRWTAGPGWGLRLSREEKVLWLNEGLPPNADSGPNLHGECRGYLLCSSCGRILRPEEPEKKKGRRQPRTGANAADPFGHTDGCPLAGSPPRAAAIATLGKAEILRLLAIVPQGEWTMDDWGLSLGYALRIGMLRHYALSEEDIDFELEGAWTVKSGEISYRQVSLAFIDPNLGGSGYLARIAENFDRIAETTLQHLDHPNCQTACYRCLKSYQNQRHHEHLKWPGIVGDLDALKAARPVARPPQTGDIDDPKPWLEAYEAGVGSPLELKFLRLFEKHGLAVDKQVAVAPSDDAQPISTADFVVTGQRIAIYIDSAAFHVGRVLSRDRFIRDRLRNGSPPWKVVQLRAEDLGRREEVVRGIRSLR